MAIAELLGYELVFQHDGTMEVDNDLIAAITDVAEDGVAGRVKPRPGGPDWLIVARELSKVGAGDS